MSREQTATEEAALAALKLADTEMQAATDAYFDALANRCLTFDLALARRNATETHHAALMEWARIREASAPLIITDSKVSGYVATDSTPIQVGPGPNAREIAPGVWEEP